METFVWANITLEGLIIKIFNTLLELLDPAVRSKDLL